MLSYYRFFYKLASMGSKRVSLSDFRLFSLYCTSRLLCATMVSTGLCGHSMDLDTVWAISCSVCVGSVVSTASSCCGTIVSASGTVTVAVPGVGVLVRGVRTDALRWVFEVGGVSSTGCKWAVSGSGVSISATVGPTAVELLFVPPHIHSHSVAITTTATAATRCHVFQVIGLLTLEELMAFISSSSLIS